MEPEVCAWGRSWFAFGKELCVVAKLVLHLAIPFAREVPLRILAATLLWAAVTSHIAYLRNCPCLPGCALDLRGLLSRGERSLALAAHAG